MAGALDYLIAQFGVVRLYAVIPSADLVAEEVKPSAPEAIYEGVEMLWGVSAIEWKPDMSGIIVSWYFHVSIDREIGKSINAAELIACQNLVQK